MPTVPVRPISYGPGSAVPRGEHKMGGALGASLFFHALVVGLLFFFAHVLKQKEEKPLQIFELVAGEGDAYDTTEAPAGNEAGRATQGEIAQPNIRPVPVWTPPEPPLPAPPPPVSTPPPAPVAPVQPIAPPRPVESPMPNLNRTVQRAIQREEKKAERQIERDRAAEARKAADEARRMKFEQFQQQHGRTQTPAQRPPAPASTAQAQQATGPRLDPDAIRRGVTGATGAGPQGAGGQALTADTGPVLERYFALLRERLRQAHEKPAGLSDLLNAEVEFTLAANGAMTGVRIVRSSGNPEFDRSVLDAFYRVRSIGPRPDGKTDQRRLTFRMRDAQ